MIVDHDVLAASAQALSCTYFDPDVLVADMERTLTGKVVVDQGLPFGGSTGVPLAILTNLGRQRISEIGVYGIRFADYEFEVGSGGYDPVNPNAPTMPDPSRQTLENAVWSRVPVDRVERPSVGSACFLCRLEVGECALPIGEIGIFATVTDSGTHPTVQVGDTFLLAVAHFPARYKSYSEVSGFRVVVQSA